MLCQNFVALSVAISVCKVRAKFVNLCSTGIYTFTLLYVCEHEMFIQQLLDQI